MILSKLSSFALLMSRSVSPIVSTKLSPVILISPVFNESSVKLFMISSSGISKLSSYQLYAVSLSASI